MINVKLPDGWLLEPYSKRDGDDGFFTLQSPTQPPLWVTIDFKARKLRSGISTTGSTYATPGKINFEGRGWRQRLVDEGVKFLRNVAK
jgi:hypothetical protein